MKNNDQGFYIGKNDQTERHYQVIFYLVFKLMERQNRCGI